MANIALLALCFAAGWLARRSGRLPSSTPLVLNAWVMWLALPALVLGTIHGIAFRPELLLAALSLWLVFGLAAGASLVAIRLGADRKIAGALGLTAGLGNTAFVGLPLLEALAGREAMELGLVVDQLGSFVVLSFLALPFAAHLRGERTSLLPLARRVVLFPPFLALFVALLTRPLAYPDELEAVLRRLADTLSPIALASIGYQLRIAALRRSLLPLALGLSYKMILAPLLVSALFWALAPRLGLLERVAVAQAAMAPMVTAALVAADHELDAELAALMVGLGVPLSLVSVPLLWELLRRAGG